MTIETTTNRISYTGSGTTGPFSFPYYFLADGDLTVIKTTIADGTEETLTITTDYTVSGAGEAAGGSVTLVATLSSAYKLTIIRDPDILQPADYPANDRFPAATHEEALDRATMILQRLKDYIDRSFRLSDGDVSGISLILSNLAAGELIAVNSAGTGIESIAPVDVDLATVSAFIQTLLDDANAAAARTTLGAAALGANTFTGLQTFAADIIVPSINGGPLAGFRNVIINGGFTVNQRVYASAATLATTVYGHDRWKAGASGGDYSFSQLASNTTITIASGKSLIQVVEDKNVHSTAYVLSWTGTAQARYAVNSATPSGSYAASPIVITGQTAGTVMSVEFNTGTLGKVQLETGSVATPFEQRPFGTELALCQRYYYRASQASGTEYGSGYNVSTTTQTGLINFPVTMRAAINAIEQTGTATDYSVLHGSTNTACSSVPTFATGSANNARVVFTVASGLTAGQVSMSQSNGAASYLGFPAEL